MSIFVFLAFLCGICFQSGFNIRFHWDQKLKMLIISELIYCLIAFITILGGRFNSEEVLLMVLFLTLASIYATYKKELLPNISEEDVIFYTLLAWYVVFVIYPTKIGMLLSVIPTLIVLYASLTTTLLPRLLRTILYCWYTIISILIMTIQFIPEPNQGFLSIQQISNLHPGFAFYLGMFSMLIIPRALTILLFLPNDSNRKKDIEKHRDLILSGYDNSQTSLPKTIIMIIGAGIFFAINHTFQIIPGIAAIGVAIIFHDQINRWLTARNSHHL